MIFAIDAFESMRYSNPEFYNLIQGYIDDQCIRIETEKLLMLQHKHLGIGLGDIVHAVANPVAKAIDYIAGTDLQNCGGCMERQATLNL